MVLPEGVVRITSMSGENSARTWRQTPQGGQNSSERLAMAMRVKQRYPSLTALKTAVRSAQLVGP